jgi:hypothetical protein
MAVWNDTFNSAPADGDSPSQGDDKIRETRAQIWYRGRKEHEWGGSSTADGWHKEGSGKAYYATSAPTVRPDGSTTLDSDDNGRLYFNSSTKILEVIHSTTVDSVRGGASCTPYEETNPTQDDLFDTLDPFIPDVDDAIPISGSWATADDLIYIFSYGTRTNSTTIDLSYIYYDLGSSGTSTTTITDGSASVLTGTWSIAW